MAGSHVIVKSNNEELPDRTFEEAGALPDIIPVEGLLQKLKSTIFRKNTSKNQMARNQGLLCIIPIIP